MIGYCHSTNRSFGQCVLGAGFSSQLLFEVIVAYILCEPKQKKSCTLQLWSAVQNFVSYEYNTFRKREHVDGINRYISKFLK